MAFISLPKFFKLFNPQTLILEIFENITHSFMVDFGISSNNSPITFIKLSFSKNTHYNVIKSCNSFLSVSPHQVRNSFFLKCHIHPRTGKQNSLWYCHFIESHFGSPTNQLGWSIKISTSRPDTV